MTTAVTLSPVAVEDFFIGGVPAVAGKLFVYQAGTLTKLTTYTDSTGATPQTNPIIMNSRGEPENSLGASVGIWVPPGVPYKLVFATPTDTDPPTTPIWTVDNVGGLIGGSGVGVSFDTVAQLQAATISSTTVKSVTLTGYYAAGDGGWAVYIRSGSAGPGPGLVQSADGQWWVLSGQEPNLRQFGAKGDGVTDDSGALQNGINFASAIGLPLYVPSVAPGGAYSLQTRQTSGISGIIALCLVPTGVNVTLFGDGYESVFSIPDAFSSNPLGAPGDYSFFVSKDTTPHLNVEISNIRIYGNGGANLVLDSGTNVRRGYGFRLLNGGSFYCHDCYFEEMAGRNVLNIAASASPPGWTTSRVINNTFTDVGGAIAGNENQSDHSTIYIEAAYSLIDGNILRNTNTSFNPFASPQHPVTGIEEHSARAVISSNTVFNYGTAANTVAAAFDVWEHIWIGNQFLGMKSNVVQPIAEPGFKLHRFLFHSNAVEVDNTTFSGGAGILQSLSATVMLGHLSIRNNLLYCLNTAPAAGSGAGIFLCAADYLDIYGNEFAWWQGPGIELFHSNTSGIGIGGGVIDNNKFINCALANIAPTYSIAVIQPDTNKTFSSLTFGPNNFIQRTPQAVGTAPLLTGGITIIGGGNLQDIQVYTPKTLYINRTSRVVFTTTTNNRNVVQVPRTVVLTTAGTPIRGMFDIGGENVVHSDPAPSGTFGRVTTTGGSASEAVWATATAYAAGEWIRLSTNKVVIYTVAGTSDAATEPTPSVLGQQYTDGTATLIYVDTLAPVLKTYGAISA